MLSVAVKRRIKKVVLWTEVTFILILGAGMGIVLGAFYQMNKMLPADSQLDSYRPAVGTTLWSADGVLLAKVAHENREPVPLDRIPDHLQKAMVAIEDSRFYQHGGLDYRGLTRSLWVNLSGGELAQGGSTITQQLARNMYLSPRKTVSRKIKEMLLAIQIERNWTKRQILERYLNQVYFGSGAYGVQAAAQTYFKKDVRNLTLPEAALIAGLVQRPSNLSPYVARREGGDYERPRQRRDTVLSRMAELKFISREQAEEAQKTPVVVAKERPRTVGFFRANYFAQYVLDELRTRYKYDQDIIDKGGLKVVTTLNWKMQQVAEQVAKEELRKIRRSHRVTETAMACLDPHTGFIRAMVGGVNEPWEKYQFNCAVQARRQPGSAFKTFVYAAALEAGHTPYTSVSSYAAIRMPDGKVYSPRNHGTARGGNYVSAFAASINGAAVNVAVDLGDRRSIFAGPRKVRELAQKLGLKGPMLAVPSLALGTADTTVLEMASAYGVFAAGGHRAEPECVLQVRNQDGEVLEDIKPRVSPQLLKTSTVEGMNVLTRAVVTSGTGRAASWVPNAHGKTGTTEDYTNAWFVGYTPDLVTAVWAGNRNNASMARVYGSTLCVPIWSRFMTRAIALNPGRKRAPMQIAKPDEAPRRRWRRRRKPPVEARGDASLSPAAAETGGEPDAPTPAPAPEKPAEGGATDLPAGTTGAG